ncbi:MAG: hypothetical protein M1828_001637 [Chrysothrix sp. TS-e1954]|nr:MAG: hypothetical protein M1828_001637 [Chrysothrix sp. TS-e1954]
MRSVRVWAFAGLANAAALDRRQTTVPQYFQTTPGLFAGPTPTGTPAFLAETNPAPFPDTTYIPPQPLETQVPITNAPPGGNIYQLHGQLSHYFPNPMGLGVDEYPLPAGANITQLHMLSRHGSRYPTSQPSIAGKLVNNTGKFKTSGKLAFLNTWTYKLGAQILVPVGKQELFDSGTLHQYEYGHLYPNNGNKIIARTTSEDRMLKSAEYFLAGFFGLQWPMNATLEVIIEQDGFNNTLAGYDNCPNSDTEVSAQGDLAVEDWYKVYLADATKRLQQMITPSDFINVTDVYGMQSLCAYETVALGYSAFCDLFTYEEWQGYEYSVDLSFSGDDSFQSPTGRAVGVGYVEEIRARLQHHLISTPTAQVNTTLDGMSSTFPLNQSLYFDFSHDTNIMSILTAFGLTQFSAVLPTTHMVPHDLVVSHLEPFGARLDIEIIKTPQPISPTDATKYVSGGPTTYVHFVLNQRTLPLGKSLKQCGDLQNGWCEVGDFLAATDSALADAQFEYSCFGDYEAVPYGTLKNGVPQAKK